MPRSWRRTAASQEQSDGIGQINQAITQMDQMTQQNAALVEQAATASETMQDHARKVAQAIGVEFPPSGGGSRTQPVPASRTALSTRGKSKPVDTAVVPRSAAANACEHF